jgi:hypothetical protein
MQTYGFNIDAMLNDAINNPINFDEFVVDPNTDWEQLLSGSAPAPVESMDDFDIDAWLNGLPTQPPSSYASEPPTSEFDTADSSSESNPVLTPEPVQEELEEVYREIDLQEAIDLQRTYELHLSYAKGSFDFHQGAPVSAKDRWDNYERMDSDEVYRLICYARELIGEERLTEWQQQYLKNGTNISPPLCPFCTMPENYWCNKVITKLRF